MKRLLLFIGILALVSGLVIAQADDAAEDDSNVETTFTVQVSDDGYLVDAEGRTLYLFTNDSPGVSTCEDACLVNWPPLLFTGELLAGEGINAELLDTIERDDSTSQVTYNGWPLYYYVGDLEVGDLNGQGVGGNWFLIDEAGNAIESFDNGNNSDDG